MRGRLASLVLVLAACGATSESPVTPKPAPVAAAPERAVDVPAPIAIAGRLRAHDGGPLRQAAFAVSRKGFSEPVAKGTLAEDGSFRVEVEPGIYMLSVAAVDHAQLVQSLLVERTIEVEGNLGTYGRDEPGESLPLKVELLGADGEVLTSGQKTAARQAAGTYRLEITDRPEQAVKLRYQLVGRGGRTYNGPLADSFENDGGGDYWSIVTLEGRDALELDLAALPPAGKASQLTWSGESPEVAAVREYQRRWRPREEKLRDRIEWRDGKIPERSEELKAEIAAVAAEALAEADAAASDDAKMLLRLAHLDVFIAHDDEAGERARAEWILESVDPLDPRLGLFWNVDNLLSGLLRTVDDEAFAKRVEAWFVRMQANPDPETALSATGILLHRADERGDAARVTELYALTREPRFAGMYTVKYLAESFDPERILQRGRPFPEFELPALAAGDRPITQAERAGKFYFIEFWATWCGPCVGEMPALHEAYAKINGARPGKGKEPLRRLGSVEQPKVEFIFVSIDQSPEDVENFREQYWAMPWTHAFVGRDGEKAIMERFGFSGVPTGVLVDGSGTIVEVGSALRGEQLLPTLEKAIAPARSL